MPVQTKSITSTPAFWIAVLQGIGSVLVIFQTTYPSIGWIGLVAAIIHAVLPLAQNQPVSVFGGIKLR